MTTPSDDAATCAERRLSELLSKCPHHERPLLGIIKKFQYGKCDGPEHFNGSMRWPCGLTQKEDVEFRALVKAMPLGHAYRNSLNDEDYCRVVVDPMLNSTLYDVIRCGKKRAAHGQ